MSARFKVRRIISRSGGRGVNALNRRRGAPRITSTPKVLQYSEKTPVISASGLENKERNGESVKNALADLVVESWRFAKQFERLIAKCEPSDWNKRHNQLLWYRDKIQSSLQKADMWLVEYEGQPFTPGLAVTPLNIAEFDPSEALEIDLMVEPIIMSHEGLVRTGSIILKRRDIN